MSSPDDSGQGSRDKASGSWWRVPGRHCRSMSYSIKRRAHLCSLEERARLLNYHVSAKQSVMRVNLLPHTYGLK